MGRRSAHSPEELRQLIVDASRTIIETNGLLGLSAREIARHIGYSAGTLYNAFENIDDILMTLQCDLVGDLVTCLKAVPPDRDPNRHINALSVAYVNFALDHRRLWNLLFTHAAPPDCALLEILRAHVNAIAGVIAEAMRPLMPKASSDDVDMAARALWAGVHGITAIAVTDKGPKITPATAQAFTETLTSTFSRGLAQR
jgi:AcrR family transcriptional regulator